MGTHHMNALVKMKKQDNVEIVAVSDVYANRLEKAQTLTGGKGIGSVGMWSYQENQMDQQWNEVNDLILRWTSAKKH